MYSVGVKCAANMQKASPIHSSGILKLQLVLEAAIYKKGERNKNNIRMGEVVHAPKLLKALTKDASMALKGDIGSPSASCLMALPGAEALMAKAVPHSIRHIMAIQRKFLFFQKE